MHANMNRPTTTINISLFLHSVKHHLTPTQYQPPPALSSLLPPPPPPTLSIHMSALRNHKGWSSTVTTPISTSGIIQRYWANLPTKYLR